MLAGTHLYTLVERGALRVKVAEHSFQEPVPNSPLLLIHWCFGARFFAWVCYLPAGRSVLGKTVPEAAGRGPCSRPRAQFFPIRTDLGRANNVFIFFSLENYFIRNICVDFLLQQFHTVRVRLTFRSSKPALFTEVFKRWESVFGDFNTE